MSIFLQAPTYHLALEAFLTLMIFWLIFHKSYKPERTELTEQVRETDLFLLNSECTL